MKQVLLELKAPRAPRDHKDPRVKLEQRVIQVLEVPNVPRGGPGPSVRNRKQCVFLKLADGKDNALIKVRVELSPLWKCILPN